MERKITTPIDGLKKVTLSEGIYGYADEFGTIQTIECKEKHTSTGANGELIESKSLQDVLLDVGVNNTTAQELKMVKKSFENLRPDERNLRSVTIMGTDLGFEVLCDDEKTIVVPLNFEVDSIEGQIFADNINILLNPNN